MTNPSATKNRIGRFTWLWVTNALCLSRLFGQVDANALRAEYGPPVEEVFVLRPGVTLSIVYGEQHQVCKLDIRAARSNASVIPAALIEELLNEVVPPVTLGTPKQHGVVCSGFCRKLTLYQPLFPSPSPAPPCHATSLKAVLSDQSE